MKPDPWEEIDSRYRPGVRLSGRVTNTTRYGAFIELEEGEFTIGGVPYSEMRGIIPQLFDGISEASQRIKNIVANLKDFSRQEAYNFV